MAEGGGLLNRYRTKSSIGGSNPPLSASSLGKPGKQSFLTENPEKNAGICWMFRPDDDWTEYLFQPPLLLSIIRTAVCRDHARRTWLQKPQNDYGFGDMREPFVRHPARRLLVLAQTQKQLQAILRVAIVYCFEGHEGRAERMSVTAHRLRLYGARKLGPYVFAFKA